jgi:hypothetical protein
MDVLTIVLTVTNDSESEEFAAKAASALAHVANLPEFKEGTYDSGTTFQAPNGVTARADYRMNLGVKAEA